MERKNLKEKIRRLRAWILVIVMVVSCLFGNAAMDVWAATVLPISYNLNDSDDENSDAQITSTDHNTSVSYEESSSGTATLATATRTGYVFVEWGMGNSGGVLFTDSNGDSYTYPAGEATFSTDALAAASSEGTLYLFAQWRPENQINITYSSAYGTVDTTSETYGESTNCTDGAATVTLPTITDVGDNQTFIGWKCYEADVDGNKGNEVTTLVDYSEDIASSYENITVGGYAAGSTVSIAYPTDTENAGGNIAYYIFEAQFVEKKSITYLFSDSDTGAQISSTGYAESVDYYGTTAETITLPTATKENAFFVEWGIADSGGNLITDGSSGNSYSYPAGDATFSAEALQAASAIDASTIYLVGSFTDAGSIAVSYDADGGSAVAESPVTVYQANVDDTTVTFTLAKAPTKEGYTFLGWKSSLDADSTTYYSAGAEVTYALTNDEITFTAQWEENECTINLTYDAGDGEITSTGYTESLSVWELATTATIETLPEATQSGYFFTGWTCDTEGVSYDAEAGTLTWNTNAKAVTEITFTANYEAIKELVVSYDANDEGASAVTEGTFTQEDINQTTVTFTLAEAPTREGYTFLGWQSSEDTDSTTYYSAGTEVTFDLTVSEITFTAQWEETECTINLTYDAGDGAITSTDYTNSLSIWELATDTTIENLPIPEREGYFFTGWSCETTGVSFEADGEASEATTGTLTWDGYAKDVTKITLKANYMVIESLLVNYDANGGENTVKSPVTVYQATAGDPYVEVVLAEAPVRAGYTFLGWMDSRATDTTNLLEPGDYAVVALSEESITFIAQWEEIEELVVSYDTNDEGATEVTQVTYTKETSDQTTVTFTLAEAPTREGYTFLGWQSSLDADSTTYYAAGIEVTLELTVSEVTFTAQWEIIESTEVTAEPEAPDEPEVSVEPEVTDEPEVSTEPEIQTISGGTVSLQAGETYYLSEGNWNVEGDDTVYVGGKEFYVSADGDYVFSEVEEE